jgi:hypothetical protein
MTEASGVGMLKRFAKTLMRHKDAENIGFKRYNVRK